jgi:hypothetical protein
MTRNTLGLVEGHLRNHWRASRFAIDPEVEGNNALTIAGGRWFHLQPPGESLLNSLDPHRNPVDDNVFRQIYYATPTAARDFAATLPDEQRVHLALFCNYRSHLRGHAHAIASICDVKLLSTIGGVAGQILSEQSSAVIAKSRSDQTHRSSISLARLTVPLVYQDKAADEELLLDDI